MDTLADRLRAAMRAAGINQKQLADACGVKPPSVNGWLSEKAKFLRGANLLRAAAALGVSDEWLATGKGDMHSRGHRVGPVSAQSETVRIDPATLSRAYRELDVLFTRAGVGRFDPSIESHSVVLCHLYDVLQANGGQLSLVEGHELYEFVREQVGGSDDARRNGPAKRGSGDGSA